jgi:hypothetical protein
MFKEMFQPRKYSPQEIEDQRNVVKVLQEAVVNNRKPLPGTIRGDGGIGWTTPIGDGISEQDREANADTLKSLRRAQAKLEKMQTR